MTGLVLHPGHHELHGVTVVVRMTSGVTHVARFDTRDDRGVHLLNVASHDPATAPVPLEEFLARTRKFGVKVERKHLLVAPGEIRNITPLNQPATS